MKINFSRGVGRSLSYFVEIPEGWEGRGPSSVPYKYGKSREVGGGGGFLSEIPTTVGYGSFLESHFVLFK